MRFFFAIFLAFLSSCSSIQPRDVTEYVVGAALWHRTSAEYRALAYQSYQLARIRLDEELAKKPKNPAVVFDIDQTILDVSEYQAGLFAQKRLYPHGWDEFTTRGATRMVPGAKEFIDYAYSRGVSLFFVTDRSDNERAGTMGNLKRLGIPKVDSETVLFRGHRGKPEHRRAISAKHTIVLLVGDNLNDFDELYAERSVKDRKMVTDQTRQKFGKRFIVLPNAMFGAWEGAVYNNNWSLTPEGRMDKRHSALSQEKRTLR